MFTNQLALAIPIARKDIDEQNATCIPKSAVRRSLCGHRFKRCLVSFSSLHASSQRTSLNPPPTRRLLRTPSLPSVPRVARSAMTGVRAHASSPAPSLTTPVTAAAAEITVLLTKPAPAAPAHALPAPRSAWASAKAPPVTLATLRIVVVAETSASAASNASVARAARCRHQSQHRDGCA